MLKRQMITPSSEESSSTKSPCLKLKTRVKVSSSPKKVRRTPNGLQPNFEIVIRKIDLVTTGLPEYVSMQLRDLFHLCPENALNLVNFILTQVYESYQETLGSHP